MGAFKFEDKPIKGYENYYTVTEDGKVWSIRRNIYLKPSLNGKGYQKVILCVNGNKKAYYVHRLVAEAFIPNPNPKKYNQINHKDENKQNNRVNNLEWIDCKGNNNYGTRNKRVSKPVIIKDPKYETVIQKCDSVKAAAAWIGVDSYVVSLCCHGKRKTVHNYKVEFDKEGEKNDDQQ